MKPWRWLAPASAFALFAAAGHVAAQGSREAQLVQAAADALGGRDRIQAVRTLTIFTTTTSTR